MEIKKKTNLGSGYTYQAYVLKCTLFFDILSWTARKI
jgi:hypothetical protein